MYTQVQVLYRVSVVLNSHEGCFTSHVITALLMNRKVWWHCVIGLIHENKRNLRRLKFWAHKWKQKRKVERCTANRRGCVWVCWSLLGRIQRFFNLSLLMRRLLTKSAWLFISFDCLNLISHYKRTHTHDHKALLELKFLLTKMSITFNENVFVCVNHIPLYIYLITFLILFPNCFIMRGGFLQKDMRLMPRYVYKMWLSLYDLRWRIERH